MSERGSLQLVWYGFSLRSWLRCFFEREPVRFVYRWRLAIGPLDIRRWQ